MADGYSQVFYNTTSSQLVYDTVGNTTTKTFVIDHPVDKNKYLIHACLEGPEAGVYYRGEGEIVNNNFVTIVLPEYVKYLAKDLSVNVTPIYDGKVKTYNCSRVLNNEFKVYGENGHFYWIVHGKRLEIQAEVIKTEVNVKGAGPYLWI
jgi:hypothetical protein